MTNAGHRKHCRAAGPRCDESALYSWRLGQIAWAGGDAGDARQPSSADGEGRLDTCRRRRIGWRIGDPAGAVHPSDWAGAGGMVPRHRSDCAYKFCRSQSGDPFPEKHGDDGRVSLCRGLWGPRLESRRKAVPPRSVVERAHRGHALVIMAPGPVFEYLDKIEGECSRYSAAEPLAKQSSYAPPATKVASQLTNNSSSRSAASAR